jgi:hypothetical protein
MEKRIFQKHSVQDTIINWTIEVSENTVISEETDGIKCTLKQKQYHSTNVGRKNEVSGCQHALRKANAEIEKKLHANYYEITEDSMNSSTPFKPMKPCDVSMRVEDIEFFTNLPFCLNCQPKLSGVRALAYHQNDNTYILTSETNETFKSDLSHITNSLQELVIPPRRYSLVFDGIILLDDGKPGKTHTVQGLLNREVFDDKILCLKFVIFDVSFHLIPSIKNDHQNNRLKFLASLGMPNFGDNDDNSAAVQWLEPTKFYFNEDTNKYIIINYFKECVDKGYSGCIIRDSDQPYIQCSSRNQEIVMLKQKKQTLFKVINCKVAGRDQLEWQCRTLTGKTFSVPMLGTIDEQRAQFKHITTCKKNESEHLLKNHRLLVQYASQTANGIPIEPKAVELLQDVENQPNPIPM